MTCDCAEGYIVRQLKSNVCAEADAIPMLTAADIVSPVVIHWVPTKFASKSDLVIVICENINDGRKDRTSKNGTIYFILRLRCASEFENDCWIRGKRANNDSKALSECQVVHYKMIVTETQRKGCVLSVAVSKIARQNVAQVENLLKAGGWMKSNQVTSVEFRELEFFS